LADFAKTEKCVSNKGGTMAVGKRRTTSDPLTEHDVAERLDRAATRTLRILYDIRQLGQMDMDAVKHSRYLTNSLAALAAELQAWEITPQEMREATPEPVRR
jgi:hypothetical protein